MLAVLSVQADAVDSSDPRDCLAPSAWSLTLGAGAPEGAVLPRVCLVSSAQDEPSAPTELHLDLDAPLTPGVAYALALTPGARSAFGQPTSPAPVPFAGRPVLGLVGQRPGVLAGDVALPVRADASGDVTLLDRLEALRARVLLMVSVRRGAFTHAGTFGRGVEPKRTYSAAMLGQEAAALRAELLRDPDVQDATVRASSTDHVATFAIVVSTTFQAEPLRLSEKIEAGGQS